MQTDRLIWSAQVELARRLPASSGCTRNCQDGSVAHWHPTSPSHSSQSGWCTLPSFHPHMAAVHCQEMWKVLSKPSPPTQSRRHHSMSNWLHRAPVHHRQRHPKVHRWHSRPAEGCPPSPLSKAQKHKSSDSASAGSARLDRSSTLEAVKPDEGCPRPPHPLSCTPRSQPHPRVFHTLHPARAVSLEPLKKT